MQDNQGILLLALGHPYYARMAHNLLASLRYHDPFIQVAIGVNGEGFGMLDHSQQADFNHIIEVPVYQDPYQAKLTLDQLTPFDRTLFLDVDLLWNNFKTPQSLFDELNGVSFTIINHGIISPENKPTGFWLDTEEISNKFGFTDLYHISSECIYWENSCKVFENARWFYENMDYKVEPFGSGYPDEAFITLAMAKDGIKPHQDKWHPTYWEPRYYPRQHNREHISQFYALSVGGAFTTKHIKDIYDNLAKHYYYSTGMTGGPFQLQQKNRIFKERRKI
jgi:hypothetical protein